MCSIELPKCVYELSILSWAHKIGNNASVLASLGIWNAWNYYLILLSVSKETKQKCMFGSVFNFPEDWKIQSLSTQTQILSPFPSNQKSSFFWAYVNFNFNILGNVGRWYPKCISAFTPYLFSLLTVSFNSWWRSLCKFHWLVFLLY